MREMMWISAVIIFSVCETWGLDRVVRNASFNLRSNVSLTCSNEPRSEVMFVFWKIKLKYKRCSIAHSNDGQSTDSCNDGKSLRYTPTALYLHIPNFSNDDVGVYLCETIYTGGADTHMINVDIIAPPNISAWLGRKGDKMVAVCKAERGKPAANISWSHLENSSSLETWPGSDGFFTVESHLELPENMDPKTLSCTVRHPYWEEEKTLVPKFTATRLHFTMTCICIVVIIVAVLAGISFFAKKKLRCCGVAGR